jgi:transcriptional regulator of acetoin/glycerol metabolism
MDQTPTTRLRRLGERRRRLLEATEQLNEEIRQAVAETEGQVTRVEAAKLLGMDRTSLHRTYVSKP